MVKIDVQAFPDNSGLLTVLTNAAGHYIAITDGENIIALDPAYTGSLIAALQQAERDCNS